MKIVSNINSIMQERLSNDDYYLDKEYKFIKEKGEFKLQS